MPPMKSRYLVIITVLVLLLGSWIGRTQLAELAVSSSMRSYGLNNVTTELEQLGLNKSHFSRLVFSLATDNSVFRLEADDVRIKYKLEELKQGHADCLTISRLAIYHQIETEAPAGTDVVPEVLEPVKILAVLRKALREYIVFNAFTVKHLSLNGESFGLFHGMPLRLQATNDGSAVYTDLSLVEQSSTGEQVIIRQLVVSRLSQDTLKARLGFLQKPDTVPAGIDLDLHDTRIEGDYFVDPRLLNEWLRPFTQINNIDDLRRISGTLSFDFSAGDRVDSIVTARSDHFMLDSYRADTIEVKAKTSNPISRLFQLTRFEKGSYVDVSNFSHENFSLAETRLNVLGDLSISTDTWQFDGDVSTQSIAANYQSQSLQLEDIAASIAANQKALKIDGQFSTVDVPGQFSFALEHSLVNDVGRLDIKPLKPVDLSAENSKLSRLLTPWPYPFDLLNGSIALVAHAAWSKNTDLKLNADIQLDDAGGHYGEILFSGLALEHQLQILPTLSSIKPSKITLMQLDSGVIARNISTRFSLETAATGSLPRIVAQDLYGEIFGGSISGDELVFDLNREKNRFDMAAENIDLAEIVATQQLEDIVVTGRIDGTIPVTINQQGIFIEHGAFISDVRAGTIRYAPATGTEQLKQNPITGIALDALRDFHYSHLSADVNYTPDGMLFVSLQLKGTSPELDTKRPVHLNINTEQNLLSLLKSLRYAESVGASIDQKVRQKYEKSTSNNQDSQ